MFIGGPGVVGYLENAPENFLGDGLELLVVGVVGSRDRCTNESTSNE